MDLNSISYCAWLISLSAMFQRFVHMVAHRRIAFFLWLNNTPSYVILCFACLFISRWMFGLLPPSDSCEWCCCENGCTNISSSPWFQLLFFFFLHVGKRNYKQKNWLIIRKFSSYGVPVVAQWLTNPTRNHEVSGSIPGLAQWVEDLALLWCRSQVKLGSHVAVALV